MKILTSTLVGCISLIIVLSFLFQPFNLLAQTTCDPSNPAIYSSRQAWQQNQFVTVNVNASQFSQADLACIQSVFDNYNLSNGATQGNWSGVYFSVGYSTNSLAVATVQPNGSVNTTPTTYGSNFSAVFQINRPDQLQGDPTARGETTPVNSGTYRTAAVTNVHPFVRDCAALAQLIAHEIGHTMGLGHCAQNPDGTEACGATDTAMVTAAGCPGGGTTCTAYERYNNTERGTTGPTPCDNQKIRAAGQYNQNNVNQPNPNPTPEPDPCEALYGPGWFTGPDGPCLPPECRTCYHLGGSFCSQSGICWTPVLIDIDGNGFNLTNAQNGVMFAPDSSGQQIRTAWTSANSDDAFLVLDRNGNGQIDDGTELFGCASPQPAVPTGELKNGFLALAEYDKPENGGNNDGQIDSRDAVFAQLKLWQDRNHNGISEADELQSLSVSPIRVIELRYRESRREDEHGNKFKYRAKVKDAHGAQVGRWAWDVFPVSAR